jgi:hypothetical protein
VLDRQPPQWEWVTRCETGTQPPPNATFLRWTVILCKLRPSYAKLGSNHSWLDTTFKNLYIQTHNQNPKVFVWSAAVERIMSKIAKCKEASETLH